MTIARATAFLYFGSALICIVAAQLALFGSSGWVSPATLLAGATYCVLVGVILLVLRGEAGSLTVVGALAIWLGYILRFLYMVLGGEAYRFPYSNVLILESEYITEAFLFMGAGSLAMAFGARVAARRSDFPRLPRGQEMLYRQRGVIISLGILITVAFWAVRLLGGVGLEAGTTASHGYLTRLLPVDALFLIMLVFMIRHWDGMSGLERWGTALYVAIYVSGQFAAGTRSALIQPFVSALLAFLLLRPWERIRPRTWVKMFVFGSILLLIFPFYLAVVMYMRGLARVADVARAYEMEPALLLVGLGRAYSIISDRFPGLDNLVLVMQYEPPTLRDYLTVAISVRSAIGAIVPDRFMGELVPSTGKVFGVLYQGLPWDLQHEGAFLGFGIFYVYAGWLAPLMMAVLAGLVVVLIRTASRVPLLSGWFPVYLGLTFVWSGFISGNFDVLISVMLTQSIVVIIMIKVGQWLHETVGHGSAPSAVPATGTHETHGA